MSLSLIYSLLHIFSGFHTWFVICLILLFLIQINSEKKVFPFRKKAAAMKRIGNSSIMPGISLESNVYRS